MKANIQENGLIITNMDMVSLLGKTAKNMREIIFLISDMATEYFNGVMAEFTRANGKMVNSMGKECIKVRHQLINIKEEYGLKARSKNG